MAKSKNRVSASPKWTEVADRINKSGEQGDCDPMCQLAEGIVRMKKEGVLSTLHSKLSCKHGENIASYVFRPEK